jgi:hypothetical protein
MSGTRCGARGSCATRRSGGIGAPPGTTTSPRQELANVLGVALPAFSLLERNGQAEARPAAGNAVTGAPEGARAVPIEPRCHRFASFGAPPPQISRMRVRRDCSACPTRKEGTGVEKERPTREPLVNGKDVAVRGGPDLPVVPVRRSQVPARESMPRRYRALRRAHGRLARGDR